MEAKLTTNKFSTTTTRILCGKQQPTRKQQENSPSTSMASKGRIMTIIGGNSIDHENNNQKKIYF
jgi:hypothetical protein